MRQQIQISKSTTSIKTTETPHINVFHKDSLPSRKFNFFSDQIYEKLHVHDDAVNSNERIQMNFNNGANVVIKNYYNVANKENSKTIRVRNFLMKVLKNSKLNNKQQQKRIPVSS